MATSVAVQLPLFTNLAQGLEYFNANGGVRRVSDVLEEVSDIVPKSDLVDTPMLIVGWDEHPAITYDDGAVSNPYVTVHILTEDGRKVFNDGSTGVYDQLSRIDKNQLPILCKKGLRVSKYTFTDDRGHKQAAETYYLNA